MQIHKSLLEDFASCSVWGKSAKFSPMKCGLSHTLADEDVIMINKKLTKAGNLLKGSVAPSGVSQIVKRAKD